MPDARPYHLVDAAEYDTSPEAEASYVGDLDARRALWHGVWDWVIRECERLASEQEATPPPAHHRIARRP